MLLHAQLRSHIWALTHSSIQLQDKASYKSISVLQRVQEAFPLLRTCLRLYRAKVVPLSLRFHPPPDPLFKNKREMLPWLPSIEHFLQQSLSSSSFSHSSLSSTSQTAVLALFHTLRWLSFTPPRLWHVLSFAFPLFLFPSLSHSPRLLSFSPAPGGSQLSDVEELEPRKRACNINKSGHRKHEMRESKKKKEILRDLRKKGRNKGGKICNPFSIIWAASGRWKYKQPQQQENILRLTVVYEKLPDREKTRQTRKGRKRKDAFFKKLDFLNWGPETPKGVLGGSWKILREKQWKKGKNKSIKTNILVNK